MLISIVHQNNLRFFALSKNGWNSKRPLLSYRYNNFIIEFFIVTDRKRFESDKVLTETKIKEKQQLLDLQTENLAKREASLLSVQKKLDQQDLLLKQEKDKIDNVREKLMADKLAFKTKEEGFVHDKQIHDKEYAAWTGERQRG